MIPHNKPFLGEEEINVAQRVISSGHISQGSEVTEFENDLCNFPKSKNGIISFDNQFGLGINEINI